MTKLADQLRTIADGLDDIGGLGNDIATINAAADHIEAAAYWLDIPKGQPMDIVANRVTLAIKELSGESQ